MKTVRYLIVLLLTLVTGLSLAQNAINEPSKVVVGVYVKDIQQLDWHAVRTSWLAERGQIEMAVRSDRRAAQILGNGFAPLANLAVLLGYILA